MLKDDIEEKNGSGSSGDYPPVGDSYSNSTKSLPSLHSLPNSPILLQNNNQQQSFSQLQKSLVVPPPTIVIDTAPPIPPPLPTPAHYQSMSNLAPVDHGSDSEQASHHEDGYDKSIQQQHVGFSSDEDDSDNTMTTNGSSDDENDTERESDIEMDTFNSDFFHLEDEDTQKKKKRVLLYKKWYSKVDFVMEHLNILLSVSSVGIFIAMSYVVTDSYVWQKLNTVMLVLSIFFVVDFVRTFIFTRNKSKFFQKGNTILDIVTLLPIFITLLPNSIVNVIPLGFLRVLRILKAPRIFKIHGASTVFQKTSQLILSLVIFIILFASMITSVEGILFHNAIYYAVVTLSTVGYGDISPQTNLGRVLTSTIIIMALLYLPLKTSQLLTLLAETKSWNGSYKTNKKKFVAVIGNIYERSLNVFMKEFFYNSRIKLMPLLIFSNVEPPEYYKPMAESNKIKKYCIYIKGTPGKEEDVNRANIKKASSVFLFSKQSTSDMTDDKENILRVMAIRAFLPKVPIFVQIMNQKLIPKMISAGATQVISIQELKMSLLAQSCLSPGFSTMVMNLLRSDLRRYDDVDEYASGNSYEIFTQKYSQVFVGLPFGLVSNIVYEKMGMIIFGIESIINKKQRIKVNPSKDYIINSNDGAILLAKNKASAKRIKTATTNYLNERKFVLNEKNLEAKVAWRYDSDSKKYKCKLLISEKQSSISPNTKENRKSLHRLIIEKKKEMKHDLSVLETIHKSENSNTTHLSNIFEHSKQPKQHQHQHSEPLLNVNGANETVPRVNSTPSDLSTFEDELSPSSSSNFNELTTTISIPMPPPLNQSKVPKRFWTSHFLEDYLVPTVEDTVSIHNHIILAGYIQYIESFVRPLREPYLRRYDPIVILTPKFPVDEWESISKYPEIYIVEGHSSSLRDLKRAGLLKCSKLVVLSLESTNSEPFINDRETLLTVLSAKDILNDHHIFPILEISDPLNLHLLPNNQNWNQNDPYFLSPSFASGSVFLSTVFDSLLCQCFFNPHLLALIQVLVGKSDNVQKTKIFQVDLPDEFIGQRFGYVYEILVGCNVICMALFRLKSDGSKFVHTNPSAATILRATDKLFILHKVKLDTNLPSNPNNI